MEHKWNNMPLLPLRYIMDYLTMEDAFRAMSTCRHWRNAILIYEARRETLNLRVKHNLEKNLYLARLFKRHIQYLHVYIETSHKADFEQFMNLVLPEFFESTQLQEILFIGPSYSHLSHHLPFVKLKRILVEGLLLKHLQGVRRLVLMGCGIETVDTEDEIYCNKQIACNSQSLQFNNTEDPADAILSITNIHLFQFAALAQIAVDYDQINTSALETLSQLKKFQHLCLNINNRKQTFEPIDWAFITQIYKDPLRITLNIIAVTFKKLNEIIEKVLVEEFPITSLKVFFCKALYPPLLSHVSSTYRATLQEVVWADSPLEASQPHLRVARPQRRTQNPRYANVNPFVILCWQCRHLRRLVIHGYWIWQYDLLGFVRLRRNLKQLEISSIYVRDEKFKRSQPIEEGAARVMSGDAPPVYTADYIEDVNEFTEFKWKPIPWDELHPALLSRSSAPQRADYVITEGTRPIPVRWQ